MQKDADVPLVGLFSLYFSFVCLKGHIRVASSSEFCLLLVRARLLALTLALTVAVAEASDEAEKSPVTHESGACATSRNRTNTMHKDCRTLIIG